MLTALCWRQDGASVYRDPSVTSAGLIVCYRFVFSVYVVRDVSDLLIHDRQSLLNIQASQELLSKHNLGDRITNLLPFLSDILTFIPCTIPHKCFRRQRKRGGVLVRFKAHLMSSCVTDSGYYYFPVVRCSLEFRGWCIWPDRVSSTMADEGL